MMKPSLTRPLVVGTVMGMVLAVCASFGILNLWGSRAMDRFYLERQASPAITIVAIDDPSISQIGRWPWSRHVHADLVRELAKAGAKVIGIDVTFSEAATSEEDEDLATAIREAKNVVVSSELKLHQTSAGMVYDPAKALLPLSVFGSAGVATGFVDTPQDTDGVIRRLPIVAASTGDQRKTYSFSAQMVRLLPDGEEKLQRAKTDLLGRFLINFFGEPQQQVRVISAVDVLHHHMDAKVFKDGIVFIGATAPSLQDAYLVPTSNGTPMPGVEIHTAAFDTLDQGLWIQVVPVWLYALLLILIGVWCGLVIPRLRTRLHLVVLALTWFSVMIASVYLPERGILMDPIWPTLVFIFAYAAVTLERRITSDAQKKQLKSAFTRYVSSSVVESILLHPEKLKLGGERRRMTVFFSDIRGFTTISEGMKPEDLVHILNLYLNRMTNIVFEHAGVLDKYIGDAVMAFWNAPLDQPDHALRGVMAALHMRDALKHMNDEKLFGKTELHIGMGLNTGDMVVGNIGGDARFDYTVIGDNVNLASRLEGLTKEYGVAIIVTDATRGELGSQVLTRRLDKVAVKGKKEPVLICEVVELAEKTTVAQKELVQAFESAFDVYLNRGFREALTVCEAILKNHPEDGPTKLLKERCQHFIQEPPEGSWNGTWVYTKK